MYPALYVPYTSIYDLFPPLFFLFFLCFLCFSIFFYFVAFFLKKIVTNKESFDAAQLSFYPSLFLILFSTLTFIMRPTYGPTNQRAAALHRGEAYLLRGNRQVRDGEQAGITALGHQGTR